MNRYFTFNNQRNETILMRVYSLYLLKVFLQYGKNLLLHLTRRVNCHFDRFLAAE